MRVRKFREPLGPRVRDKKNPEFRNPVCNNKHQSQVLQSPKCLQSCSLVLGLCFPSRSIDLEFRLGLRTVYVLTLNFLLFHWKELISVANCRPPDHM